MLLLPPPSPTLFPSTSTFSLSLRHQHHHISSPHPFLTTTVSATVSSATTSFSSSSSTSSSDELTSLYNRRYNFDPLIQFLSSSTTTTTTTTTTTISDSNPPTSLEPKELHLAETYRAVPAPLWHNVLKSLCSSSIGTAYALVSWLQKHNLCYSYDLLYSILIHGLERSDKLYEAFLFSQQHTLTPVTYNALL